MRNILFVLSIVLMTSAALAQQDPMTVPAGQPGTSVGWPGIDLDTTRFVRAVPVDNKLVMPFLLGSLNQKEVKSGDKIVHYSLSIENQPVVEKVSVGVRASDRLSLTVHATAAELENPFMQAWITSKLRASSLSGTNAWMLGGMDLFGQLGLGMKAEDAFGVPQIPTGKVMAVTGYELYELRINASMGSRKSQLELLRLEKKELAQFAEQAEQSLFLARLTSRQRKQALVEAGQLIGVQVNAKESVSLMIESLLRSMTENLEQRIQQAEVLAQEEYSRKRKEYLKTVHEADRRQEITQGQLQKLIEENRREDVARVLERSMPFDLMEPFEAMVWREWIDSIRNPNPSKQSVVFRGLDAKDMAGMSEVRPSFMSNLLFDRNLSATRALTAYHISRIRLHDSKDPQLNTAKFTSMFRAHAQSASGSPYMSFSDTMAVAYAFAEAGFTAVRMDSRRALPNIVGLTAEKEIMVPLIVFPDEVVGVTKVSRENSGWGGSGGAVGLPSVPPVDPNTANNPWGQQDPNNVVPPTDPVMDQILAKMKEWGLEDNHKLTEAQRLEQVLGFINHAKENEAVRRCESAFPL